MARSWLQQSKESIEYLQFVSISEDESLLLALIRIQGLTRVRRSQLCSVNCPESSSYMQKLLRLSDATRILIQSLCAGLTEPEKHEWRNLVQSVKQQSELLGLK